MGILNKPFILSIILSLCLAVLSGYLWMSGNNKDILINKQSDKIVQLLKDVDREKERAKHFESLLDTLDTTTESVRENIETKRQDKQKIIQGIDNVVKENSTGGSALDPDLARMLSNVCEAIRGSRCPDPSP